MKLYTVTPIMRSTGKELAPRYDLAPMNHAAVCNFMDACRNASTDYKVHEWPAEVPHPAPPMYSAGYRRDGDKPQGDAAFREALEARDALDLRLAEASSTLKRKYPEKGPMGLTPDHVKARPEWKADRLAYDRAFQAVRKFNPPFLRLYKKQWKAELQARREARAGLASNPS